MMNKTKVIRIDTIECPRCNTIQEAKVTQDARDLWPIFIHFCVNCNYMVAESEWDVVQDDTGHTLPIDAGMLIKLPMGVTAAVFVAYLCEKLPLPVVVVSADASDDMYMEFRVRVCEPMAVPA